MTAREQHGPPIYSHNPKEIPDMTPPKPSDLAKSVRKSAPVDPVQELARIAREGILENNRLRRELAMCHESLSLAYRGIVSSKHWEQHNG